MMSNTDKATVTRHWKVGFDIGFDRNMKRNPHPDKSMFFVAYADGHKAGIAAVDALETRLSKVK